MRRFAATLLATTTLSAGLSGVVVAAPPVANWSGCYLGGHAGHRSVGNDLTADPFSFRVLGSIHSFLIPSRSDSFGLNGGVFGIQAGCNVQFAPNWLAGFEGDLSWGKRGGSTGFLASDGFTTLAHSSTLSLGTQSSFRGRLGIVSGPWLFYGTGGVAFTNADWTDSWNRSLQLATPAFPAFVSRTETLTGWTGGVGVEYLWASQWIVRAEYLFTDFGSFAVPLAFAPGYGNVHVTTQVLRFGVSYRLIGSP